MLSQAYNITRGELHFCSEYLAIPHDCGALIRAERCGVASAVAIEVAVSRKNISSKEEDVRLRVVLVITLLTDYYIWRHK